jgi:hypothetical protein
MDLWCPVCEIAWPSPERATCPDCGEPGQRGNLIAACTGSTGFAIEGARYARAHPTWTR